MLRFLPWLALPFFGLWGTGTEIAAASEAVWVRPTQVRLFVRGVLVRPVTATAGRITDADSPDRDTLDA